MEKLEDKLVSVAIATYNGADFLELQLQSIINQSYKPIEIIISDDGSVDNTENIVKKIQQQFNGIVWLKNSGTKGIKNNFENALKHCNGKYIALCDQDDYWLPQKIEMLVNNLGNADLIYHNSLFVDEKNNSLIKTVMTRFNPYSGSNAKIFLMSNCISGHACLFRRDLLQKALPFPNARFHDWWVAFIAAAGNGVKYLPEILVHYRQHDKSKTDMLKIKSETRHNKEFKRYNEEMIWFSHCATVGCGEQSFFKYWAKLYEERKNQWFSFRLFLLAWKNRKTIFYIPKKNGVGIFLLALKLLWGLKLKKVFK